MANDLIEIKADKNDFMINIKNIFLNEFFKKKLCNEQEKKYINDNIIFIKKKGVKFQPKKFKNLKMKFYQKNLGGNFNANYGI